MAEFVSEKWTVTHGKMHHIDGDGVKKVLRKGDTFHPRADQVGKLENKARPTGEVKVRAVSGADIGLRSLSWGSQKALKTALDAGLSVEDMALVEPSGSTGYVSPDVDDVLAILAGDED